MHFRNKSQQTEAQAIRSWLRSRLRRSSWILQRPKHLQVHLNARHAGRTFLLPKVKSPMSQLQDRKDDFVVRRLQTEEPVGFAKSHSPSCSLPEIKVSA